MELRRAGWLVTALCMGCILEHNPPFGAGGSSNTSGGVGETTSSTPTDAGDASTSTAPDQSSEGTSSVDVSTTGDSTSATDDGGTNTENPVSCSEILERNPEAPTGTHTIEGVDGQVEVHCDMDIFGGGWTRVVDFDAQVDPCPGDWQPLASPKVCHRDLLASGSRTASFDTPLAAYREVAGYVRGLQAGSMDSFRSDDIEDVYVDGVSITATAFDARVHIWTYSVSWSDDDNAENSLCPCLGGAPAPAIVGTHFYCESGNQTGPAPSATWFTGDPLWDGDGTGTDCNTPGDPSWFQHSFSDWFTSALEVRLMADQATSNEDVGVYRMELYVR